MSAPLPFLRQACQPKRRAFSAWIAIAATLTAAAALAPAAAGLLLASEGPAWAIAVGFAGACLLALRGATRQQLAYLGRTAVLSHIARVLATRSALSTASHGADHLEAKLFASSFAGSKLLADHAPALAGNVLALLVVAPFVVWLTTWQLAVIALPAVAMLGLTFFALRRFLSRRMRSTEDAGLRLVDESASLLRGHLELAAASRLDRQADRMATSAETYSAQLRRAERASAIGGRVPILAAGSLAALVGWLWLGGQPELLHNGLVKVLVLGSVLPMASGIARALSDGHRNLRELAPVVGLLNLPAAPASKDKAVRLDPHAAIRFHNVSFAYAPAGERALQAVSLTWRPGELIALTGPNGTGKSTLVRLLLRLADPQEGAIYVGPSDLREGDADAWRRGIAYLPQRPFLPEGFTLRQVLNTFGPDVEEAEIVAQLETAGLLPKLLRYRPDDPLGTKVTMLSAGEKQRFALARVLADPAPVLVLDEPDANLDAAGLDKLISVLPRLSKKRRILLVAHDRRLLSCADRVVELGSNRGTKSATAALH